MIILRKQMWRFVLELLLYSSFVCVLYVISYSNHSYDEYHQTQHLRRLFLNTHNSTHNYSQIITINDYWRWLKESFIVNIVVGDWYNGQSTNDSNGYLNDKTTRLIGWATMRQLRIKPDTCRVKSYIRGLIGHCYDAYSASSEEKGSFSPGWTKNTTQNYSRLINQAFIYQTSEQLDTYIYIGEHGTYRSGGYVYEFRGSLSELYNDISELHQLEWIDKQTRAVIIQMNLYNPSIPTFTSAVMIIEILSSSGIFFNARFDPLSVDGFKSRFQIACAFIYLTFIIYFMIVEIYTFICLKKLYFRHIWSYIEIGIIVCSWTSVGIHIWRVNEAARITRLFRETHGDIYLNFQLLAYINDIFSFLLAFCCFFGTLKFLRLCRYNRRLALLSGTLRRSARELISFSFMFSILFMAFLTLFYLQFVSLIWECSSLLSTAQMLFEMLLLKFDASEITQAAPYLGPLYFTLFILFVVFVCINMFVSIVNDNFRAIRDYVHTVDHDDQDLFINIFKKIQQWCGNNEESLNIVTINTKPNVIMIDEKIDPVKRLSNKLDKLMIYVDRRYGDKAVRIAWDETTVSTLDWSIK
ncbi:unnamed protein product [Rotaria sordida]|uniref:Uncharacterized protein n=1 Tax=Rotaria sordida TaxID=392033 RepID=A0A818Q2X1_9BILA|nr:unnamed protein product [Rotaria sordida]